MFWWIMNDAGNLHEETGSPPLGLEVHGSAFAFHRPGSFIDAVTFYRYRLHYKGSKPLEDAWVGFYADNDMGYPWDDYVASDTLLHLGYTYNADEDDEQDYGYGTPPPAVGYTILKGPLARPDNQDNDRDGTTDEPGKRLGMATFACFIKSGGLYGEPNTAQEYYNCLQGRWRNGQPITRGRFFEASIPDEPPRVVVPEHVFAPGRQDRLGGHQRAEGFAAFIGPIGDRQMVEKQQESRIAPLHRHRHLHRIAARERQATIGEGHAVGPIVGAGFEHRQTSWTKHSRRTAGSCIPILLKDIS